MWLLRRRIRKEGIYHTVTHEKSQSNMAECYNFFFRSERCSFCGKRVRGLGKGCYNWVIMSSRPRTDRMVSSVAYIPQGSDEGVEVK